MGVRSYVFDKTGFPEVFPVMIAGGMIPAEREHAHPVSHGLQGNLVQIVSPIDNRHNN